MRLTFFPIAYSSLHPVYCLFWTQIEHEVALLLGYVKIDSIPHRSILFRALNSLPLLCLDPSFAQEFQCSIPMLTKIIDSSLMSAKLLKGMVRKRLLRSLSRNQTLASQLFDCFLAFTDKDHWLSPNSTPRCLQRIVAS